MSRTARETIEELLRLVTSEDRSRMADLYADGTVIENRFAPGSVPDRTGRENLRTRMKTTQALFTFDRVDVIALTEAADPEIIISEYDVHGRITETGEPFDLSFVMVTTVRDGLIVSTRDYSNPQQSAALSQALKSATQAPN